MKELDLDNLEEEVIEISEDLPDEQESESTEKELSTKKTEVDVEASEDDEDFVTPQKSEDKSPRKSSRAQERIRELVRQRNQESAKAQQFLNEKKKLEEELRTFKKSTVTTHKAMSKDAIEAAKKQLKAALESGDHDAVVEAQAALNEAQLRMSNVQSIELEDDEDDAQEGQFTQQQPSLAEAPVALQEWLEENDWFLNPRNQREAILREAAIGFSNVLIANGEDPTSPEFYSQISEKLGLSSDSFDKDDETPVKSKASNKASTTKTENREKRKISQTVQGASRTPASQQNKNRIRLTPEQIKIADAMGVSHVDYARELLKIEKASERGEKTVELF